jgi:hypothetical protein
MGLLRRAQRRDEAVDSDPVQLVEVAASGVNPL